MKSRRLVILSLAVVLLVSWASMASASHVYFDCRGFAGGGAIDGITRIEGVGGTDFYGEFDYTPTNAGSFSQQSIMDFSINAFFYSLKPISYDDPGPPYTRLQKLYWWSPLYGDLGYYVNLDQSGPLRFTDLAWEVKMIRDGSETTIFSLSADADLVANGGIKQGGQSFLFGDIIIPVEMTYEYWGLSFGPGWYADGNSTLYATFIVSQTGHVVPVPSTVFLLGSGLLGLVGWRRFRKG